MGLNTQTLNATFQCAPPRLEKPQHSCGAVLDEEMDIQKQLQPLQSEMSVIHVHPQGRKFMAFRTNYPVSGW